MARSTYIYLVTKDDAPVAAFTVKYEMEWWIANNTGTVKRWRMGDGKSGRKAPVEIDEP